MDTPGHQAFARLLDACNAAQGAEREALEREVWARFGAERTVLVLDMAGFSAKVRRFGLLPFLRKIRYMQTVVRPRVEARRGEIVKFEADNAYAVFPEGADAVHCGLEIHADLRRLCDGSPDIDDVQACIGLARGRILLIPGCDLFGDAVNLASRLGEDLARPEEVLADPAVAEAVKGDGRLRLEPVSFTLPGAPLEAVRIAFR